MSENYFKVIRITKSTGQVTLLTEVVSEDYAWKIANLKEGQEASKKRRRYYFAVTNDRHWRKAAKEFLEYRRRLSIHE
jgi:predicted restriction endonuclease